MSTNVKINSVVLQFGKRGGFNATDIFVQVDYPVVESKGLLATERTLEINESNFIRGYRRLETVTYYSSRVKAGPGKGKLRRRFIRTHNNGFPVSYEQVKACIEMETPLKLIGDWICDPVTGTIQAGVALDPIIPRSKWGLPVILLDYTCEAARINSTKRRGN